MVMCSPGAMWQRRKRASTGATVISPHATVSKLKSPATQRLTFRGEMLTLLPPQCLGIWAASWTLGHPLLSAVPVAPPQSSQSRCAFDSAA